MPNVTTASPPYGSAPPPAVRGHRRRWPLSGLATSCRAGVACLVLAAAAPPVAAQEAGRAERQIVVSLAANRLWLLDGRDTILAATVAVGRHASFRYRGRTYDWRTPVGERKVLGKERAPVWDVPQWHYYERAANEDLELVEMVRNVQYELADGSHLAVLGADVVRVRDGQYWKVPQGREIIIGRKLYVPPVGTRQRRVPGVLGTRALDLGEGYLIHGTNPYNRTSVGSAASHGCVRMETGDIERLFELVDEGTRVLIY